MKKSSVFHVLVSVTLLVTMLVLRPHDFLADALGQNRPQDHAPPALGLIQTADGMCGSSFLGLAVRRAWRDHVVQLLGDPTSVESKVGYMSFEWKGTPWCTTLGLEKLTVRYDGPIVDRMGLFLSEPVDRMLIEWMLDLGPPESETTGEEDGRKYGVSVHSREGLATAVTDSGGVGAILLLPDGPQDPDGVQEPVDGLFYVRPAQPHCGPSFLGLACGRVHREHVRALLGEPDRQPDADYDYWENGPWIERTGLKCLGAASRPDGTVECLELVFHEPCDFSAVCDRLGLAGEVHVRGDEPEMHFFIEHGIALAVEDNEVTGLLLNTDFPGPLTALPPPTLPRARATAPTLDVEFRLAIDQGDSRRVRDLLGRGATARSAYAGLGEGPLHGAAADGHLAVVRDLLAALKGDKGRAAIGELQESLEMRDGAGLTPLHWAAWKGHEEVCQALVAAGAEVDARDRRAMTPLHFATLGSHERVVSVLLQYGAHPNARDADGKTPIEYCEDEQTRSVLSAALEKLRASPASQEIRQLTERFVQGMRDGDLSVVRSHLPPADREALPASVEALPLRYTIAWAEAWKEHGEGRTEIGVDPAGDLPDRYSLLFEFEWDGTTWKLVKADLGPLSMPRGLP